MGTSGSDAERASAIEFILEGLHLTKQLNRDVIEGGFRYTKEAAPSELIIPGSGGVDLADERRAELRRRLQQRRRDRPER
jgi:hypothetical protein